MANIIWHVLFIVFFSSHRTPQDIQIWCQEQHSTKAKAHSLLPED